VALRAAHWSAAGAGDRCGRGRLNGASRFTFIRAEHDLAAVLAYLHRFRDRPTTLRAYTRELERLILWSVVVRQKALSSLTVEDCEASASLSRLSRKDGNKQRPSEPVGRIRVTSVSSRQATNRATSRWR